MNYLTRGIICARSTAMLFLHNLHSGQTSLAAVKKTSAAGGVMGLGKGKKKLGKLGTVEKQELPVESDPNLLVTRLCGSDIRVDDTAGPLQLGPDSAYPEWLWSLELGSAPPLQELDPTTKRYWLRVRTAAMRRNNKLRSLRRF